MSFDRLLQLREDRGVKLRLLPIPTPIAVVPVRACMEMDAHARPVQFWILIELLIDGNKRPVRFDLFSL